MHIYRSTFGGRHCEILLHLSRAGDSEISAWALSVRPDGRRDPLVGGDGRFVRARAGSVPEALAAMKCRLETLLGDEQIGPDTSLLGPGP